MTWIYLILALIFIATGSEAHFVHFALLAGIIHACKDEIIKAIRERNP